MSIVTLLFRISTFWVNYFWYFDILSTIIFRGSIGDGWPENTLAAFKDSCLTSGSDCIELDVWLTKDGVVVIHHDERVNTSSSDTTKIASITESNYKDLPSLTCLDTYEKIMQCRDFKTSSTSTTAITVQSHEYTQIPTLKQVFESIPKHVCIIVEFKQNSVELIEKVQCVCTVYVCVWSAVYDSLYV